MAYDSTQARREMLTEIALASDDLAAAIAALGEAYELLDDDSADRLETELFGPVQTAYGRAKRTHAGFAERMGLASAPFEPATAGHPSQGVAGFLESAVAAVARADLRLSELQDSMRPVDVGDPELRAGLADVRTVLAEVPARARGFMRTFGR